MKALNRMAIDEALACIQKAASLYVSVCGERGINFSQRDTKEHELFTRLSKAESWIEALKESNRAA